VALLRIFLILFFASFLTGCEFSYLLNSGYHQAQILRKRVSIEQALKDPKLNEDDKKKLSIALEVRNFAENELGLKTTKNYTTYVHLDRPYVSYVVSAAPKFKLEAYMWSYPIVGDVPYKGFFSLEEAQAEAKKYKDSNLDVYVRGVSAYSTLGWFRDPILSSMLRYEEFDLVNIIIHETTHATLFIKSNADFNERMATFAGNKGTELFYIKKEGVNSPTLKQIKNDNNDDQVFAKFITKELGDLKKWYEILATEKKTDEEKIAEREERFTAMKTRYNEQVLPQLKTERYKEFAERTWNNAYLISYQTYFSDLSDFEKVYEIKGSFGKYIEFCKSLEGSEKPEQKMKEFISRVLTEKPAPEPSH
jgi:predicted aminopeptidase